jgi:hypothetical protein
VYYFRFHRFMKWRWSSDVVSKCFGPNKHKRDWGNLWLLNSSIRFSSLDLWYGLQKFIHAYKLAFHFIFCLILPCRCHKFEGKHGRCRDGFHRFGTCRSTQAISSRGDPMIIFSCSLKPPFIHNSFLCPHFRKSSFFYLFRR